MNAKAQRVWLAVWALLALALVIRAGGKADDRGVILDSLEFGRRLALGEDVYGPWQSGRNAPLRPLHAPYPPSFGLGMAPFALVRATLGLRTARCAWGLLQVAALVAIFRTLRRLPTGTAPPEPGRWPWLVLATLLLGARFVLRDTAGGGGNLIILACSLLAWDAAERQRAPLAGLWLGLSLLTKPTQALLLPVLWLAGHRRASLWTIAVVTVGFALSLVLMRGDLGPWQRWWSGSLALMQQEDAYAVPALGFPPFEWMNQSLRCAVARWFGTVPAEFAARVPFAIPQGLGLPPATTAWITRGLAAIGIGALAWMAWRSRTSQTNQSRARFLVFVAALTLSLPLSPLSWKAHHVALLPALLVLVCAATEARPGASAARWLLAAFVATCVPGQELLGNALDEMGNSLYLVTAMDLLLIFTMMRSAARTMASSAGTPLA